MQNQQFQPTPKCHKSCYIIIINAAEVNSCNARNSRNNQTKLKFPENVIITSFSNVCIFSCTNIVHGWYFLGVWFIFPSARLLMTLIWRNHFGNLDKYILQFEQIQFTSFHQSCSWLVFLGSLLYLPISQAPDDRFQRLVSATHSCQRKTFQANVGLENHLNLTNT